MITSVKNTIAMIKKIDFVKINLKYSIFLISG